MWQCQLPSKSAQANHVTTLSWIKETCDLLSVARGDKEWHVDLRSWVKDIMVTYLSWIKGIMLAYFLESRISCGLLSWVKESCDLLSWIKEWMWPSHISVNARKHVIILSWVNFIHVTYFLDSSVHTLWSTFLSHLWIMWIYLSWVKESCRPTFICLWVIRHVYDLLSLSCNGMLLFVNLLWALEPDNWRHVHLLSWRT